MKRQRRHHLLIAGLWLLGATTAAVAIRLVQVMAQPQVALAMNTASRLFVTAQSPGAIAVGAAEGNLTPTGEITGLYYGHIDPGNHVTNRGFCSWNGAAHLTVAEANQRCLLALQQHATITEQQLRELSLNPSNDPAAVVNGTDLWNQSDQAGPEFASKYQQALAQGLSGSKALVAARVEAFRNSAGQLDAGGLFGICRREPFYQQRLMGLTQGSEAWRWHCIALDQRRRVGEVASALAHNLGTVVTVAEKPVSREDGEDSITSTTQSTTSVNLSFSPGMASSSVAPAPTHSGQPFRLSQPESGQSASLPEPIAPSATPQSISGTLNFTPAGN